MPRRCRPHMTLTMRAGGIPTSPATVAGLTDHVWTMKAFAEIEVEVSLGLEVDVDPPIEPHRAAAQVQF